MTEQFDLSEMLKPRDIDLRTGEMKFILRAEDVKEFIRLLKEEIRLGDYYFPLSIIDKLAGASLI